MKKRLPVIVFLLILFPTFCVADLISKEKIFEYLNWEELQDSFSADLTSTRETPRGTFTRKSKIYKKGTDLLRIETEPTMLKAKTQPKKELGDLVVIRNLETKKAYLVFPARESYVEASTDQLKNMMEQLAGRLKEKVGGAKPQVKKFEKLGTERIEGVKCDKVHCVVPNKQGGETDATAWLAQKYNNFPMKTILKTKMPNGAVVTHKTQFENLKRMSPSKSLFEVPSGYTKYKNLRQLSSEGKAGGGEGGQKLKEQIQEIKERAQERRKKRLGEQ